MLVGFNGIEALVMLGVLLVQALAAVLILAGAYALGRRWYDRLSAAGTATPEREAVRRSLAEALRAAREEHGFTQELVAQRLGVSRQAVSKWETGKADPSTTNLLALASLYEIDPADLLRGVK